MAVGGASDPIVWLAADQGQKRDDHVRARRDVWGMRRDPLADLETMGRHAID
jgi:hypothetical protein